MDVFKKLIGLNWHRLLGAVNTEHKKLIGFSPFQLDPASRRHDMSN